MRHQSRYGLLAGGLALALANASAAGDLSAYYTNTIVMKDPKGASSSIFINADKSYGVAVGGKVVVTGTWTDDGAKTCYTQITPPPPAGAPPRCIPSDTHKLGDSWTIAEPSGAVDSFTLVAGR